MTTNWPNILNLNALTFTPESISPAYACESAPMAKKMGARQLGFHCEIIPPGKFSAPYHFHHKEEELFIILEGKLTLRQCDKYREVKAGDVIVFPTGPEGAHQFYNHTNEPCKILALSTNAADEICEYPDSKKILYAATRKCFQNGVEVDYLKDEEDPSKYWP